MSPIVVSIDGNIGSGKSTILHYIEQNFGNYCKSLNNNLKICFLQEPVSIWESIIDKSDGKNVIEKFYENNEKYAFAFQMMAYISRLSIFQKALTENYDIIFTERSVYTDRNVFAKMLHKSGKMNEIEHQIYNKWFDEFSKSLENIKIIYIRTSPETCEKRVKKRNRVGEDIPIEYLHECNYYHESWLNNTKNTENTENSENTVKATSNKSSFEKNILVINGNEETNTNIFIKNTYYDDILEKIYNFVIN